MNNKIKCLILGHKFTGWGLHPLRGDKQERHCTRCGKVEERF